MPDAKFCEKCRRIYHDDHACRSESGFADKRRDAFRNWLSKAKQECNDCSEWGTRNGSTGCLLSANKPCDIVPMRNAGRECFASPPKYQAFDKQEDERRRQPVAPGSLRPDVLAHWSSPVDSVQPFQILVKSIFRWNCVERLVKTVHRFYPGTEILIADDSFRTLPDELPEAMQRAIATPGVYWWQLPYDTGLAASRQFLVECATADYLVQCDDDFVFMDETRIDLFIELLESRSDIDAVCGLMRMDGTNAKCWNGKFELIDRGSKRELKIHPLENRWEHHNDVWFRDTDLGFNFYCVRRQKLIEHPRDEHFKIVGEHLDQFLQWKEDGFKIVETPNVVCGHWPERPQHYNELRNRKGYHIDLARKWNLDRQPNHAPSDAMPVLPRNVKADVVDCLREKPNIMLLTVGHTGSTVVMAMLEAMGWNLGNADSEFREHIDVRDCNIRYRFRRAKEIIKALPEPWAIKDPRFCETLDKWADAIEQARPLLLWLRRDAADVETSYRKRGEDVEVLSRRLMAAQARFDQWTGKKIAINYEDVRDAVRLFDR